MLVRVNAGPIPVVWADYCRLQAARDAGTLSPTDHADPIRLTDRIEAYRAAVLAELAAKRGQTLTELADALSLRPPIDG